MRLARYQYGDQKNLRNLLIICENPCSSVAQQRFQIDSITNCITGK
jgi:hypothetical protein